MLGLHFCARAFSSCGKRGPLFIAVRGPLTVAASLLAEHRLQTCRLSSCGSRAQLLHGMWGLPRPGLEPVSPALAGGFSTTAPPGKPSSALLISWGWSLSPVVIPVYGIFFSVHICIQPVFHLSSCMQVVTLFCGYHYIQWIRGVIEFHTYVNFTSLIFLAVAQPH